jgi:hypothetical protein
MAPQACARPLKRYRTLTNWPQLDGVAEGIGALLGLQGHALTRFLWQAGVTDKAGARKSYR